MCPPRLNRVNEKQIKTRTGSDNLSTDELEMTSKLGFIKKSYTPFLKLMET